MLLFYTSHQTYQSVYFRVEEAANLAEHAIEVSSAETGAVVASHYSVRVDHRHYVETATLKHFLATLVVLEKSSDESL